jgi:integrase
MPTGRISKRSVDSLACPTGKDRIFLWDDSIAGFGVVAFPSGRKVYVCQYRRDGVSRRVAIGGHGRLTPSQARGEARKLLGSVEAGADPAQPRRQGRSIRMFGDAAEDFLRLHVEAKRKARTAAEYRRTLGYTVLPMLGSRRMDAVGQADMARIHTELADSPYEANKVLAIVSSLWNWAASRAEPGIGLNPCVGIERYPERARERFLTSDELGRLGVALRCAKVDPFAASAILLLILTGARLREILDAQWRQVDFERGVIFLPDSKTGVKPIYLNTAALAALTKIPRLEGNPHIIPGSRVDIRYRPSLGRRKEGGWPRRPSTARFAAFIRLRWRRGGAAPSGAWASCLVTRKRLPRAATSILTRILFVAPPKQLARQFLLR